jgi:hypothetical protein
MHWRKTAAMPRAGPVFLQSRLVLLSAIADMLRKPIFGYSWPTFAIVHPENTLAI